MYYDPEIGRYISAKDIGELNPQSISGLNLFAYSVNNPVTVNAYTESIAKTYGISAVNAIANGGNSSGKGFFNQQLFTPLKLNGKILVESLSGTGFFHEGTGRFEWKIGKQDGKNKFGIKIGE